MANRFEVLRDEPVVESPWGKIPEAKPITIGHKTKGSLTDYDYLAKVSRVASRPGCSLPRARIEVFESKEHARIIGKPRRSDVYYGTSESIVDAFTRAFNVNYIEKARWEVETEEKSPFLDFIAEEIEKLF
jgi:hypothetical protein